jgi:sialate O-acetylesterase
MAVTIDVGEPNESHPRNKQDVGKRLALWALAKVYGFHITFSGPVYRNQTIEGGKIRISFDYAENGLMAGEKDGLAPVREVKDGRIGWFAIAGEDRKWHWANAVTDGPAIVVSSDEVPNPVAVRYAFTNNPEGIKLYNREGLPASPFRTDNWKYSPW